MTADVIISCRSNKQHYPVLATPQVVYALIDVLPSLAAEWLYTPLNLCLVLDHSGSMAGERLQELKQGVKRVLHQLTPRDTVSLVIFDDRAQVVIPSQRVQYIDLLHALVNSIRDGGGTHLSGGLELGLAEIRKAAGPGTISRILLLTDGQTWGDEARCMELAAQARQLDAPITALGLGVEFNDRLLLEIAEQSGPGGIADWIEQPQDIAPFFERVVQPMQATTITNATLTLRMMPGVMPRQVWQVLPLISNLGHQPISERDVQVTLGDIDKHTGKQLLVELVLPPIQPGAYRIAQAEVSYDVPLADITHQRERADIVLAFTTDQALSYPVDPAVMNIVEKVTAFRLQTQALRDVDSGNIQGATTKLRQAATRLLSMGEDNLATTFLQEAEYLEKKRQLTDSGTKQLRYKTGKLVQRLDDSPSPESVSQPRAVDKPDWSPPPAAPVWSYPPFQAPAPLPPSPVPPPYPLPALPEMPAAPPPPPPPSPRTDTGALAPSPVPDTLERYPDISLPDKTVLQHPCTLRVAITQQAVHERFKEQKLALFVDREQDQTTVDVLVTAPDFQIIGDPYRPLVVPRDRDSDPVVFQLIPTSEGEKPVKVEFFHDARYVGGVTVTTQVLPVQPMLQPEDARAQGRIAVVLGAPAPDLTILISEGRDEAANRRAYRFKLHAPSLGFYFYPVKEPLIFTGSPTAWMEGLYAELGGIHRTKSRERVAETLRTIGADLYEKLFPRELKDLWKKRIRQQVRSILIVSDEPWIPWEIIRPSHEMEDGRTVEDDFLCETYLLARWIAGSPPPAVIAMQTSALIVPGQSGLRYAKDEVAFIRAELGNVTEIEPNVTAVWAMLKAGGFQVIHFICHGRFDPERHEQSMLYLQGKEEFKARDISGERRNFGKDRPFVFLNACQTARGEESLVGIGSWAEKFIGAESGGFLGSSWDVTDSLAARFSQSFYRSLLKGQTIGEAVHRARLEIKEDADPTWLAYALYADPLAKAVFSASVGGDQSHLRPARVCSACGSAERPDARFCSQCGQRFVVPPA